MSKLSEKIEQAKRAQATKEAIAPGNAEEERATKGLMRQLQMFGKTIKISELQTHYEFLRMNQKDLIDCISWAINTIKNKKSVQGQDPNTQYYRNFVKWNELRDYLRGLTNGE